MITLAMLSLGGAFLFSIPKISEVCADVETVEEQNYVEHQSTGVVGTERKSVFFYVSVWNNKTNEQNLVGNGKTCFVKDDETIVLSFARRNADVEKDKGKEIAKSGNKELNTTANVSFATMLTKRDGQDVEGFSNVIQSGTHEYY